MDGFMEKLDIGRIERGTPVVLHGCFGEVRPDGRVMIYANGHEVFMPIRAAESRLKKCDPTRLFKKGDKVKLTKWNGRICEKFLREGIYCGENLTVVRDEDCFLNVTVRTSPGIEKAILSPFLELVTSVEDLEKWHVYHDKDVSTFEVKTENHMETASIIFYGPGIRTEKEAEKAAEAECDRLNAEYRKEAANG